MVTAALLRHYRSCPASSRAKRRPARLITIGSTRYPASTAACGVGADDLQFVLFNARRGRRGLMRRFLFFPDYLIGRPGLLKHCALRILCLARLAVAPPDDGREVNLTLSPGHNGISAIHK
jgi:hypothetical protein